MKARTLILLAIPFLVLCGCARATDYFPLSDGAQWEYSVEYPTMFSGPKTGKVVSRIDGSQTINGKTYFKLVTISSGMPVPTNETNLYRLGAEGIYRLNGTDEHLFLPSALKVGMMWTVNGPSGELRYRVEGFETAHLVDKKFDNCVKISFEGEQTVNGPLGPQTAQVRGMSYRAKGIGEVKVVLEGTGGKAEVSLENYSH